jgi:D-alanyl-D-alanine endopeptidase (penicillin-binding protein 7)
MLGNLLLNLILSLFFSYSDFSALTNNPTFVSLKPNAGETTIAAECGAVLAAQGRFFFYAKNADEVQPIASITKLMTALIFLENNPGWEKIYEITTADKVAGGRLNLFPGDNVKIKDLFYTSLVASDNGATLALVNSTGLSETEFVAKMNKKAKKLGLTKTHFVDPIGLSSNNVSTAREVALFAKVALSQKEIRQATESKEYTFVTLEGKTKKLESTDYLLFDSEKNSFSVLGGKTGYTDQAGYCFVGRFKDSSGQEVISVVLNSAGKNERFRESKTLVNWVFQNYNWLK